MLKNIPTVIDAKFLNSLSFSVPEEMLDGSIKNVVRLRGDIRITGNIADGIILVIEDGILEIDGDVGAHVMVCFQDVPIKKTGFFRIEMAKRNRATTYVKTF